MDEKPLAKNADNAPNIKGPGPKIKTRDGSKVLVTELLKSREGKLVHVSVYTRMLAQFPRKLSLGDVFLSISSQGTFRALKLWKADIKNGIWIEDYIMIIIVLISCLCLASNETWF